MQAIKYFRSDEVVHETFTFFEDGVSEIRAQREEKTNRIRRIRWHDDVFPRFARFLPECNYIFEGLGDRRRQCSQQVRPIRGDLSCGIDGQSPKAPAVPVGLPRRPHRVRCKMKVLHFAEEGGEIDYHVMRRSETDKR